MALVAEKEREIRPIPAETYIPLLEGWEDYMTKALVVVDVQNDFSNSKGSLYVSGGEKILPIVNELIDKFARADDTVIYTRDWHPTETIHFKNWPPHCILNTWGSEFDYGLEDLPESVVITKGTDPNEDSYSGFDGRTAENEDLETFLKRKNIDTLYVTGLATDHCVKQTVLDARMHGFKVYVVRDAIAAVNQKPEDGKVALEQMHDAGATIVTSKEVR